MCERREDATGRDGARSGGVGASRARARRRSFEGRGSGSGVPRHVERASARDNGLSTGAASPSRRARHPRDVSAGVKRRRRERLARRRGDAPCTPTAYIVARSMSAASRMSYSSDALPLSFSSLGTAEATACSCAARDVMAAASRVRNRSKRSRRFAHAARVSTPRPLADGRSPRRSSTGAARASGTRASRVVQPRGERPARRDCAVPRVAERFSFHTATSVLECQSLKSPFNYNSL